MKQIIALAVLPFIISPAFADDAGMRLLGHRAVYELTFDSARTNSGVVGADGRYVFDLEDACEGYALNERLVVNIARTEDRVLTDYRLSAFESTDGASYRFSTETQFNGVTGQEASGNLTIDTDGQSATVDYAKAEDKDFDEPILTPVAHVRGVLEAARAGEDRHAAMIFDGDVDGPIYYAVTRIAAVDTGTEVEGAETLNDTAQWKIDSAYYPPAKDGEGEGATPEFSFSATMFDNGVMADLRLDYGEFALKATLSGLEIHSSGC